MGELVQGVLRSEGAGSPGAKSLLLRDEVRRLEHLKSISKHMCVRPACMQLLLLLHCAVCPAGKLKLHHGCCCRCQPMLEPKI
jgi:hypothetical protein